MIAFLTGTFSVLFEVSRNTLFVALVARRESIGANALLNGSRAMSFVAGPSVGGGALGATLGIHPTLWIATIGATAAVLLLLPSPLPSMREFPAPESA